MALCCVVCGEWYHATGSDRIDICTDCWRQNFAGNPLEPVTAREALDAYVCDPITPRQVDAMRRLQARWQAEQEDP